MTLYTQGVPNKGIKTGNPIPHKLGDIIEQTVMCTVRKGKIAFKYVCQLPSMFATT